MPVDLSRVLATDVESPREPPGPPGPRRLAGESQQASPQDLESGIRVIQRQGDRDGRASARVVAPMESPAGQSAENGQLARQFGAPQQADAPGKQNLPGQPGRRRPTQAQNGQGQRQRSGRDQKGPHTQFRPNQKAGPQRQPEPWPPQDDQARARDDEIQSEWCQPLLHKGDYRRENPRLRL